MKKAILSMIFAMLSIATFAQLNMTLLSQVDYNSGLNDIWGYVDEDTGIEYALVGAQNGVSIVSLEDPENAVEVSWIPGQQSTWRDLKTWGKWCYVTTDQNNTTEGVTVIDLTDVQNGNTPYYHWTPSLPNLGTLETCHNIYIDEFGYGYLAGCDVNSGGMVIVDFFTTPGTPIFVAPAPSTYAHDVYVRDNIMYASEIYNGELALYDVSDKLDIEFLGSTETPFSFTHNAWISDDSNYAFTTDEQANAPVASYDISDPSNIQELDLYYPLETLGAGVIPHNVHVWNDFLIISYYSDGGIIVDALYPDNLIEVGNFDTFFGGGAGFNGAWGAYPFLPSGIVLVTDIGNGLYVLGADYVRACYLEGKVTSSFDGTNLFGVEVEITSPQLNQATTNLQGIYKTGQEMAGTFDVTFTKAGYVPKTVNTTIENGEITILDVELDPLGTLTGSVVRDDNGNPVPNSQVIFDGTNDFAVSADASGNFQLIGVEPGDYQVYAGAWGYVTSVESITLTGTDVVNLTVGNGYYDDFTFDFDWDLESDASSGDWEWVEPEESTFNGAISTPGEDVDGDFFENCYVTGNGGDGGSNDVDNGTVSMTSPVMDLSTYDTPILSYQAFFYNGGGGGGADPDDELSVQVSNGTETVEIEVIDESLTDWSEIKQFDLSTLIDLTDNMTVTFETSDFQGSGHIVEAAVDFFQVIEGNPTNTLSALAAQTKVEVSPNPTIGQFNVMYELPAGISEGMIEVYHVTGQLIEQIPVASTGATQFGTNYGAGAYFLRLTANGELLANQRIIKNK